MRIKYALCKSKSTGSIYGCAQTGGGEAKGEGVNWGPARDVVWTPTPHPRQPQWTVRELQRGWGIVLSGFPRRKPQSICEQGVYWRGPGTPTCVGEGGRTPRTPRTGAVPQSWYYPGWERGLGTPCQLPMGRRSLQEADWLGGSRKPSLGSESRASHPEGSGHGRMSPRDPVRWEKRGGRKQTRALKHSFPGPGMTSERSVFHH